jgi:hypothetical protein
MFWLFLTMFAILLIVIALGDVAERSRTGLQIRAPRFDSGRRLHQSHWRYRYLRKQARRAG